MDDAAFLLWTWLRSWEKDFGIKHNTGRAILDQDLCINGG